MQVESIAECSNRAFCNTFDPHKVIIGLENIVRGLLLSDRLTQVLTYAANVRSRKHFKGKSLLAGLGLKLSAIS